MNPHFSRCMTLIFAMLVTITAQAQDAMKSAADDAQQKQPLGQVIRDKDRAVQTFDEHIVILSSPFMEGRLPGTAGMERAKDYMQEHFEASGLMTVFPTEQEGELSYRQVFPLGVSGTMVDQSLVAETGKARMEFELGSDFQMTGMGSDGDASGQLVFVGYAVGDGPDGYMSFDEDLDLEGKIALVLRFEPMDGEGRSLWSGSNDWTDAATFMNKISQLEKLGPEAVILVNTPGADDPRIRSLIKSSGQDTDEFPFFHMSTDAADRLVRSADRDGRTLMDLRRMADEQGTVISFDDTVVSLGGTMVNEQIEAENVGGLLSGRGELADQYIVIGGHLDHLGMGEFGSREGPGKLHPGADDNASGSIAVLMLADSLAQSYEDLPEDQDLRSIIFIGFSAEESGLNGSRWYADNPPRDIEDHVLMINFDMIGRVRDNKASISGTGTGTGLGGIVDPIAEKSELDITVRGNAGGGSDHISFLRKQVPILSGGSGGHADYHTSKDTSDMINREGAADIIDTFHEIALAAAMHPERFEFTQGQSQQRNTRPSVRLGVRINRDAENENGVTIRSVAEGGPAAQAGIMAGDVITSWNGEKIPAGTRGLQRLMMNAKPGDTVEILLLRDGREESVTVTLQARPG